MVSHRSEDRQGSQAGRLLLPARAALPPSVTLLSSLTVPSRSPPPYPGPPPSDLPPGAGHSHAQGHRSGLRAFLSLTPHFPVSSHLREGLPTVCPTHEPVRKPCHRHTLFCHRRCVVILRDPDTLLCLCLFLLPY